MSTAVDTNVFSALLSGDEEAVSTMQAALEDAAAEGLLAVSPPVYAELVAGRDPEVVDTFFSDKGLDVDWNLGPDMWRTAGARYGAYARDRWRQRGDAGPRRILADFLIGAHALHLAHALLTSDTGIYGTYFPELEIISPPSHRTVDTVGEFHRRLQWAFSGPFFDLERTEFPFGRLRS